MFPLPIDHPVRHLQALTALDLPIWRRDDMAWVHAKGSALIRLAHMGV